ncbi:hypothetical protein NK908_23745, partial [Salmonella enterica subsp. enterica serovar Typhimurium]|nr:hypothetical protein [Salmonella enterica subsp. enterica serovar Typhimurium]
NFRLPYITVTPTFSICPRHGYLDGEHEFCPHCDEDILRRKRVQPPRQPQPEGEPDARDTAPA